MGGEFLIARKARESFALQIAADVFQQPFRRVRINDGCDDFSIAPLALVLRLAHGFAVTAVYVVRRIDGYSAIDQARNQIGSDALADGFHETLWIDSDVGFDPNDVNRLRKHGLPITCGIYPKKGKRELAVHILPGTPQFRFGLNGGLQEILYGGTGFLHVRREVYDTMAEVLQLPVCNAHANRPLRPYFQPLIRSAPQKSLDSNEPRTGHWYLAEDFAFCHRARQCGFAIVADTSIRLWHIGDYAYSWEDAGIDRQRFGDFHFQFNES